MGIFDFVKDAGEGLKDKVLGDDGADDLTKTVEVSSERVEQLRQENIAQKVAKLDIDGEQVNVEVNGSVAVLTGSAPSQEALEKIVLCAGNQFGIAQVDCQLLVDAPEPAEAADTGAAAPAAAAPESVFYGAAGKYMAIFEANQPMLSDPDKIYPGQKLRIPPA